MALSVILLWGFSFIAIEIGLKYTNPTNLVLLRFLPIMIVFAPIAIVGAWRNRHLISKKDWLNLAVLGFFSVIGYNVALNTGQTYLPASFAALVIALNPATIAVIATLALKERPGWRVWLGLTISLIGISFVILLRSESVELRLHHLLGVGITIFAPLSWGIYSAGLRKFSQKIGPLLTTSITMTLGTLPLLFVIREQFFIDMKTGGTPLIVSGLFLGFGCTVYGFTGWAAVLKKIPASRAGAFIYMVPIVAAIGSRLMLNEAFDLPLLLGVIVVLTGVILSTRK